MESINTPFALSFAWNFVDKKKKDETALHHFLSIAQEQNKRGTESVANFQHTISLILS